MTELIEIIVNIFIYMNMYWYVIVFTFVPALYYILLNFFQFPLLTNKIHELVIIMTPEKIKIKKITARYMPFFNFKNGIYWFDIPCSDIDSLNQIHTYIAEVNQPITKMERRKNKVNDLITNQSKIKQLSGHKLLLLRNFKKHLHRHYTLTIDAEQNIYKLTPTDIAQPLKINFYHSIGVYIQKSVEQPKEQVIESSGGNLILQAITTQTILQQVQYVQEHSYYSSNFAFNLLRKIIRIERNYMMYVLGSIDPKIIAVIIAMVGMIAGGYLLMTMLSPANMLGDMPT